MTFDSKAYNREWMRKYRERMREEQGLKKKWDRDIDNGHCPVCSMLLSSAYHVDCPYLYQEE